jgi:1-deoxy-D-xylulose-5-phosphate synthase
MRFVKPLDEALILRLVDRHRLFVTIEENAVAGGAGSAVAELLSEHGILLPCLHLGLPDRCQDQAAHEEQLVSCGLDSAGIEAAVRDELRDLGLDEAPLQKAGGL